tara:strand:+ start:1044 stop:1481 length:438 start_codon:yes stop_codon:yes gene_type:complete
MKFISYFGKLLKPFLALLFSFIIIYSNSSSTIAITMNQTNEFIVEELRLSVPYKYMETWIKAEKEIWEPWLSEQDGFLGRKIFYNKDKGEALLLVNWKNKDLWKKIPNEEVNRVQNIYEKRIKDALEIESNPFQLIYEGELFEQI